MKKSWKVFLLSYVIMLVVWFLGEQPDTPETILMSLVCVFGVVVAVWVIVPIGMWVVCSARPRMDDEHADQIAEEAMRERLGMK